MKKILIIVVLIIASFGLFQLLSKKPANISVPTSDAQLIFFWGEGCPHCEKVKQFITTNKLDAKVKISSKEVYNDKNNQALLEQTIKNCPEIDTSKGIGVPLAYDTINHKCLYGDQSIIDWLQPKVLQ